MGQFETLDNVLGVLRRQFALILGLTLIGTVLSLFYVTGLPRTYEAHAVIQIELPSVAESAGTPSTGSQTKHRLNLIEQQLMARNSLTEIIADLGLFGDAGLSETAKTNALRLAVTITQIIDPAEAWRPDAVPSGLLITVRLGDAQQAAQVANTFLERILIQSEARRHEQAVQALSFFENEAARIEMKITGLESEVATFKQENAAAMPAGIPSLRDQLASLKETELEIERQIIGLTASATRVREDVFERQVAELEAQNDLVLSRITRLNAALADAPQVERQFSRLSRELEQLQAQFTVITQRRAEAEMSQALEIAHKTERFEVLETALVPDYPVSPSRKKILAAGIVLFLMLGVGIAVLLELLNPAIRTSAQLERTLGVEPIVTIPRIGDAGREGKGKGKGKLAWILAILVGIILAAVLITRRAVEFLASSVKAIWQKRRQATL